VSTAPAFPAKLPPSAAAGAVTLGCDLRVRSTDSDVYLRNRTAVNIPAGTRIEVRSDNGGVVTLIAVEGVAAGGEFSKRKVPITGDSCTAKTVMVLAP
jgi:hypothetical protein